MHEVSFFRCMIGGRVKMTWTITIWHTLVKKRQVYLICDALKALEIKSPLCKSIYFLVQLYEANKHKWKVTGDAKVLARMSSFTVSLHKVLETWFFHHRIEQSLETRNAFLQKKIWPFQGSKFSKRERRQKRPVTIQILKFLLQFSQFMTSGKNFTVVWLTDRWPIWKKCCAQMHLVCRSYGPIFN